jgi:hypothetical protein
MLLRLLAEQTGTRVCFTVSPRARSHSPTASRSSPARSRFSPSGVADSVTMSRSSSAESVPTHQVPPSTATPGASGYTPTSVCASVSSSALTYTSSALTSAVSTLLLPPEIAAEEKENAASFRPMLDVISRRGSLAPSSEISDSWGQDYPSMAEISSRSRSHSLADIFSPETDLSAANVQFYEEDGVRVIQSGSVRALLAGRCSVVSFFCECVLCVCVCVCVCVCFV